MRASNSIWRSPAAIQVGILIRAVPGLVPVLTLRHRHLDVCFFVPVVLGADSGDEVDGETPHVEREYQRDGPFDHGRRVIALAVTQHAKRDTEAELNDDEEQLDNERDSQDAEVLVVHPETVVLPADEDGGDDIASTENGCQVHPSRNRYRGLHLHKDT